MSMNTCKSPTRIIQTEERISLLAERRRSSSGAQEDKSLLTSQESSPVSATDRAIISASKCKQGSFHHRELQSNPVEKLALPRLEKGYCHQIDPVVYNTEEKKPAPRRYAPPAQVGYAGRARSASYYYTTFLTCGDDSKLLMFVQWLIYTLYAYHDSSFTAQSPKERVYKTVSAW